MCTTRPEQVHAISSADTHYVLCAADIAAAGDDGNYGSAATLDVLCLQALSKRIHYGKFVAEAKFRWALVLGARRSGWG